MDPKKQRKQQQRADEGKKRTPHVSHPELGSAQRLSPEEKALRHILDMGNIPAALDWANAHDAVATLEKIAKAESGTGVGKRAAIALLLPLKERAVGALLDRAMNPEMNDELLEKLTAGDGDLPLQQEIENFCGSVEELTRKRPTAEDILLWAETMSGPEGEALRLAVRRLSSEDSARGKMLRFAAEVPECLADIKRIPVADAMGFVGYVGRMAKNPSYRMALERLVTDPVLGMGAEAGLIYMDELASLRAAIGKAIDDLSETMGLVDRLNRMTDLVKLLATKAALAVLGDSPQLPEEYFVEQLLHVRGDELQQQFVRRFLSGGARFAAKWACKLGIEERSKLLGALQRHAEAKHGSAMSRAAVEALEVIRRSPKGLEVALEERVALSENPSPAAPEPVAIPTANERQALGTVFNV